LGYFKDEMSVHRFRASASSIMNESGLWNPDAVERQLAHIDNDSIRRAYGLHHPPIKIRQKCDPGLAALPPDAYFIIAQ
jgi:integrase